MKVLLRASSITVSNHISQVLRKNTVSYYRLLILVNSVFESKCKRVEHCFSTVYSSKIGLFFVLCNEMSHRVLGLKVDMLFYFNYYVSYRTLLFNSFLLAFQETCIEIETSFIRSCSLLVSAERCLVSKKAVLILSFVYRKYLRANCKYIFYRIYGDVICCN